MYFQHDTFIIVFIYQMLSIVTCRPLTVIITQDFSSDQMIPTMTDDTEAGDEFMTLRKETVSIANNL